MAVRTDSKDPIVSTRPVVHEPGLGGRKHRREGLRYQTPSRLNGKKRVRKIRKWTPNREDERMMGPHERRESKEEYRPDKVEGPRRLKERHEPIVMAMEEHETRP